MKEQVSLKPELKNAETKPDTENQKKNICQKTAKKTIVQKIGKKLHSGHYNARRNKWAGPV
jgi:hypothetical protein